MVRFFNAPRWAGIAAAAGFVVATTATLAVAGAVGFTLNGSIGYAPIPTAMAFMAVLVARRDQRAAFGMLLGAAIFVLSLALRTVDRELCASLPLGTHFGWHLLNGVVIATMIVVFIRRGRLVVDDRASRLRVRRPPRQEDLDRARPTAL